MLLPSLGDHTFIQMPNVMAARRLALEAAGVVRSELQGPAADGLIGNDNSALKRHLFDEPQVQGELEVKPDGIVANLPTTSFGVHLRRLWKCVMFKRRPLSSFGNPAAGVAVSRR